MQEEISKETIIAEYLAGGTSYRKLAAKYGVGRNAVYGWVTQHNNPMNKPARNIKAKSVLGAPVVEQDSLPADVAQLQKLLKQANAQLRQADLKAKFLDALIDNAEKDYGIAIRKKAGSRQ